MHKSRKLYLSSWILLLIGLIWAGCDFVETESDPNGFDPDPPKVVEQVTENVGPAGGVLKVDGVQLDLPPGALTSETALTLALVESSPAELEEEIVTGTYTLTGLPDDFTGAIEIRLKYDETLEDSSYVTYGTEVMIPSTGTGDRAYHFLPTVVTDSTLVATLPAVPAEAARAHKSSAGGFVGIFGVSKYRTHKTSAGHFSIVYPRKYVERAQAVSLGEYLETAFTHHEQLGLSFAARTRWPISVEVLKLKDNDT